MATLLIREPDGSSRNVDFEDSLTIGRSDGCELQLPAGGVSRTHAVLTVEVDGSVWVEDQGSAHGTFLDGAPLEIRTKLPPQVPLQIGDYTLELLPPPRRARPSSAERPARRPGSGPRPARRPTGPGAEAGEGPGPRGPGGPGGRPRSRPGTPSALARRGADAPTGPHLKGATGPWMNRTWGLRGRSVVGRQEGVTIHIDDVSVSRQHAELGRGPEGFTVRDLGSANGSMLNGQPLGDAPETLADGDLLVFGGVEFVFNDGASAGRHLPVRRRAGRLANAGDSALGVSDDGMGADGMGAADPGTRKKIIIGASILGALMIMVLVSAFVKDAQTVNTSVAQSIKQERRPETPEERIDALLSECRTHSSLDLGNPDWERAEAACNGALDLDPIHEEAVNLIKRITLEKESANLFRQAERAMQRNNPDEALSFYRQIPSSSAYFPRARTEVTGALEAVKERHLRDCKVYIRNRKWQEAAQACERHMVLACPSIPREEIVPPVGYTLSLRPRRGRNEWKPTNADFVRFLDARQRAGMGNEPWECPVSEVLVVRADTNTPKAAMTKIISDRYSDKYMQAAILAYWEGQAGEASALLQRVRNNVSKASLHAEVDQLRRQVDNVFQLYQNGQAALQQDEPEQAERPFREAMELDEQLIQAPHFRDTPSFYRMSMQKDLAASAYEKGKFWADRRDPKKGCTVWKMGFTFFTGNIDLNKAVRYCSELAFQAMNTAQSCDALREVMVLAVDGDGIKERVDAKMTEFGCL